MIVLVVVWQVSVEQVWGQVFHLLDSSVQEVNLGNSLVLEGSPEHCLVGVRGVQLPEDVVDDLWEVVCIWV